MVKKISILGSTGSIGRNSLRVIEEHPDRFKAVALAGGENLEELCRQIEVHKPRLVSISSAGLAAEVRKRFAGRRIDVLCGREGLDAVARCAEADIVIVSLVGSIGLMPTYNALASGKDVALANKEALVMAGRFLKDLAREKGVSILPIDSEHSAIHQCLAGRSPESVRKFILTGSGGPFRGMSHNDLERVGPEQALKHPVWKMGKKITIDSATLANKGLEVIEAHWLFDAPPEKIEVLIHPECIVHSMIEFRDGSILCQMGVADMRIPIQYALSYPERLPLDIEPLELASLGPLTFEKPDFQKFPCLTLAYEALKKGDRTTVAYNCANEVANESFRSGRLGFLGIPKVIEETMMRSEAGSCRSVEEILDLEIQSRKEARRIVDALSA